MIDTIVLAAAGRGTRMGDLAVDKPKHLISVAGKPFLHYLLEIVHTAGFSNIIVVTGYHHEQVEAFLDGTPYNTTAVYQPDVVGDKHGTAAVVEAVQGAVGDRSFVFANGDSLYPKEVLQVIRQDDGLHRVIGVHHPDPTHYGVIDVTAGGALQQIVEKPKEPVSNLINLGIYGFQPEIFDLVKEVQPSSRGEHEIVDALNTLAAEKKVRLEIMDGDWVDLGRPEDIAAVEQFLLDHHL